MHKITLTISDFLSSTLQDKTLRSVIANGSISDTLEHHAHTVIESLESIKANSQKAVESLQLYRCASSEQRTPEKLRSSTANLVRSVEAFKKAFSELHPASNVHNHPLVGCLYGYQQRRTATLDKAALVAYEIVVDVWALSDEQLDFLVAESERAQTIIAAHINEFSLFVERKMNRLQAA